MVSGPLSVYSGSSASGSQSWPFDCAFAAGQSNAQHSCIRNVCDTPLFPGPVPLQIAISTAEVRVGGC